MASLSKLWLIFKLVWIERMVYRVNFFLDILSGILSSLIVVFLWMAIYRNADSGMISGYSLGEMVTYLLGGGLLNSFILTTAENPETSQSIQDGTLSTLLIKPFSPYAVWFARDMGGKTFLLMLGVIGYLGVIFFFREYLILFASPGHLLFFVFSVLFAALLQFLLFEALSLLSFWIENTYGIRFTMRVIMEVAGGAIIPLSFFPDILQKFLMLLPFPYMIYLPMQIYLGKIPLDQMPFEFLKESIWIIGLILINFIVWKRGVRQYVSMGD
jgi:ABC-2 type transport system permease protein